jgi:deoxycytidine triphosphate deaminase
MKMLQRDSIVAAILSESDAKSHDTSRQALQIVRGSSKRAKLVSYNPVVGRAVSIRTGEDIKPNDESLHVRVHPREAIFITSREIFKLKKNQIGICFGRVINAHRSLMIDANIIDPGYDGELHCVLRNFGENSCAIDLIKTPIMKVVIFEIDGLDAAKDSSPEESIARTITELKEQQVGKRKRESWMRWLGIAGSFIAAILILVVIAGLWPNVFESNGLLQSIVTIFVFFLAQGAQFVAASRKQ